MFVSKDDPGKVLGSCVRYIEIFLLFFCCSPNFEVFSGLKHLETRHGRAPFSEALALL